MDGSLIGTFVSQLGPADGLLMLVIGLIGWFLWQHTRDCKQSRKDLYDAIKENTDQSAKMGERIAALEAVRRIEDGLVDKLIDGIMKTK